MGADSDLQLFHDGSNAVLQNNTGTTFIIDDRVDFQSSPGAARNLSVDGLNVRLPQDNAILNIAKEVVKAEIDSLKKLHLNIGKSFQQVVKTIINCKNGKIINSGVGKSGIIGKKWSATLSSTGTPSFFLDASNASHGDMGQITSNDIIILISLSGESNELKNIIQYVSRNNNIMASKTLPLR